MRRYHSSLPFYHAFHPIGNIRKSTDCVTYSPKIKGMSNVPKQITNTGKILHDFLAKKEYVRILQKQFCAVREEKDVQGVESSRRYST